MGILTHQCHEPTWIPHGGGSMWPLVPPLLSVLLMGHGGGGYQGLITPRVFLHQLAIQPMGLQPVGIMCRLVLRKENCQCRQMRMKKP